MAGKRKIIIDTDPGVDDILALLLAFAGSSDEVEVLLVSLTYGNVEVEKCLRNVVTLFHIIEKELGWREQNRRPLGFDALRAAKPLVAIGAEKPLADQLMMADYFHGLDGLGGIYHTHPHLSPGETWKALFESGLDSGEETRTEKKLQESAELFRASQQPAHEEILRLLRENDKDSITIVAIGPLTNTAMAAATNPETFLRAKEVVVMGGTINEPGNITPVAEFNTFADSVAAARVFALTSPRPRSTLPPVAPLPRGHQSADGPPPYLGPYPEKLSRQLNLTLFPLDITSTHELTRGKFVAKIEPLKKAGSPLAAWTEAFLSSTFNKMESLHEGPSGEHVGLALHDPLCIWYCLINQDAGWKRSAGQDLRVETSGQWTRGMYVSDKRDRKRREDDDDEEEKVGDSGNWLSSKAGNRMNVCVQSPGASLFAEDLLKRIFGV